MLINPTVVEYLKGVDNQEIKKLIFCTYRYNSKLGKGLPDAIGYEKYTGDLIGKNLSRSAGDLSEVQTVAMIIELCPDFEDIWLESTRSLEPEDKTYSLLISKFAEYIVEKYKSNSIENFKDIFDITEVCLRIGETTVQNTFTTSLLEDIQNLAGNQDINPNVFLPYLGDETQKWWNEINRFWDDLENYYTKNTPS